MTNEITAYPLAWPHGKKRTLTGNRRFGKFGTRRRGGYGMTDITVTQAVARIKQEAGAYSPSHYHTRINPDEIIFSSNLRTRRDGLPAAGQREPDDPGVAVYFKLDGNPQCIAIDTYTKVADNFAAVAAVLEALRALDRHGSGLIEAAFTGFTALPDPSATQDLPWRKVLDYDGHDLAEARARYRRLAAQHHPDRGGDATTFNTVRRAWDAAARELANSDREGD